MIFESVADESIGKHFDSLVSYGRTGDIPAQVLKSLAVMGWNRRGTVKREAFFCNTEMIFLMRYFLLLRAEKLRWLRCGDSCVGDRAEDLVVTPLCQGSCRNKIKDKRGAKRRDLYGDPEIFG